MIFLELLSLTLPNGTGPNPFDSATTAPAWKPSPFITSRFRSASYPEPAALIDGGNA
jgi:hypothetical protein